MSSKIHITTTRLHCHIRYQLTRNLRAIFFSNKPQYQTYKKMFHISKYRTLQEVNSLHQITYIYLKKWSTKSFKQAQKQKFTTSYEVIKQTLQRYLTYHAHVILAVVIFPISISIVFAEQLLIANNIDCVKHER